jgi:phosphate transport system protein
MNEHARTHRQELRRRTAPPARRNPAHGRHGRAQLDAALDVVERRDDKAAERIVANDEAIDAIEREIDHDVMRLALRGPMARDLRVILAALKVAADIERIGDYAANVAKRSMR